MRVGFVGLGLMGKPMATRVLNAGHTMYVHNRTKQKAEALTSHGAVWCDSAAAVAQKTEIVVSMLSTPDVLESVAIGKKGILESSAAGLIHVDCSTVSPSLTRRLHEQYRAKNCFFLHSPVLGSVPNATEGSLLLFVGGEAEAYRRVESILRLFGQHVWHFDRVEQASNTKLLCNFFIASMISGLAQGLVFAERSGIDPKIILDILDHSSLGAPTYQTKGAMMVENNFAPRFFLEHMLKDIRLLLDSARTSDSKMPSAEAALKLYEKAAAAGFSREDYSAVVKVLR